MDWHMSIRLTLCEALYIYFIVVVCLFFSCLTEKILGLSGTKTFFKKMEGSKSLLLLVCLYIFVEDISYICFSKYRRWQLNARVIQLWFFLFEKMFYFCKSWEFINYCHFSFLFGFFIILIKIYVQWGRSWIKVYNISRKLFHSG